MNGYRLTASEEDATQAVLALAAGTLGESGFAVWMRANVKRVGGRRPIRRDQRRWSGRTPFGPATSFRGTIPAASAKQAPPG